MGKVTCYETKLGRTEFGLEVIRFLETNTYLRKEFIGGLEASPNNCNVEHAIRNFFQFLRSKAKAKLRGIDKEEYTKEYIISLYTASTHEADLIRYVARTMPEETFKAEVSRVIGETAERM